jgi:hypothetical protein
VGRFCSTLTSCSGLSTTVWAEKQQLLRVLRTYGFEEKYQFITAVPCCGSFGDASLATD